MAVIAISGSASGIGAALRRRLESTGDTVLGIDLRDAEIVADLATREGRADPVCPALTFRHPDFWLIRGFSLYQGDVLAWRPCRGPE